MALKRNGGAATKERTYAKPSNSEDEHFEPDDTDTPSGDTGVVPALFGWKEAQKSRKATGSSQFPDRIILKDGDEVLVKFLSPEPMTHYTHWVGGRGYTCLRDENFSNADCPLCQVGDEARPRYTFTVAEMDEDSVTRKIFECGPMLLEALIKIHENSRLGPIDKNFVILTRSGSGYSDTSYDAECVRERDLEEEFGITPAWVAEQMADMSPCGEEVLWGTSKAELQDIANKLVR